MCSEVAGVVENQEFAYDNNGRVIRPNDTVIMECNVCCKCSDECQNRVVQRGRTLRLEIFMTKNCGWGLRTLEPIQKGTYIDSYLGLVITREEAERRESEYRQSGLSYLFDLDFFEDPGEVNNPGTEQAFEAYESIENLETPNTELSGGQLATQSQKKRRRSAHFGGSRKRRAKVPSSAGNGRSKKIKEEVDELSEYEETGYSKFEQEKPLSATEEVGQSSRATTRNQSAEQKPEVPAGYKLESSNSPTSMELKMPRYSLDSKDMGNVTRFSNHSCDPNLDIYSVVTGSPEIFTLALFANRPIAAGSELTFSYSGNTGLERAQENKKMRKRYKGGEDTELFRCRCGSRKCVGYYWN
ncbi:unnamed protein product [Tuber melanosporum]|uniref:(Perigord truffle) hypothetical protein n=1 Tax=Tuber melanosporum (strain Mel28) TaxID=656061 RepID=D5G9C4_TUBMM|nr:uncharacterized protein GSTUM_00003241001 [Tuber melanosporum]CAZ81117.1 unnamed protein product [Tuber melanosporum]